MLRQGLSLARRLGSTSPSLYPRATLGQLWREPQSQYVRHLSQADQEVEDDEAKNPDPFIYNAPFGAALRRVKVLSVTSCGLAIASCPVILFLPNLVDSTSGRLSLCTSLALFGVFTTGLLHWFSSPYVHQLKFNEASNNIDVKTLTLFAQQRWEKINLDSVKPADTWRPLATFEAHGRVFYIHDDQFKHKPLLKKLSPSEPDTDSSA